MLKGTAARYGLLARLLHWGIALLLLVVFILGWWTVELGYYDPLYRVIPGLHRSLGILVAALIAVRILWTLTDRRPAAGDQPRWQQWLARSTHLTLYLLMVLIPVTGYLISTADGRAIDVFGLIQVPALLPASSGREELAGRLHYLFAFGGAWLVLLHAAAALKHHFIDRDATLRRMIG